mmetsp:Transcript_17440/g.42769  ORF Transcript_17440/g.42769 Transcript_17440/m.42769 type:complete len:204 (+) Transcript_17440:1766-2377(+)
MNSGQLDGSQVFLPRPIKDTITQGLIGSWLFECDNVSCKCIPFGHDFNHLVASPFLEQPVGEIPLVLNGMLHIPSIKEVVFISRIEIDWLVVEGELDIGIHETLCQHDCHSLFVNVGVNLRNDETRNIRRRIQYFHLVLIHNGRSSRFNLDVINAGIFWYKQGKPKNEASCNTKVLQDITSHNAAHLSDRQVDGFTGKAWRLD